MTACQWQGAQVPTSDVLISTAARSPPAAVSQSASRATCAGAASPRWSAFVATLQCASVGASICRSGKHSDHGWCSRLWLPEVQGRGSKILPSIRMGMTAVSERETSETGLTADVRATGSVLMGDLTCSSRQGATAVAAAVASWGGQAPCRASCLNVEGALSAAALLALSTAGAALSAVGELCACDASCAALLADSPASARRAAADDASQGPEARREPLPASMAARCDAAVRSAPPARVGHLGAGAQRSVIESRRTSACFVVGQSLHEQGWAFHHA